MDKLYKDTSWLVNGRVSESAKKATEEMPRHEPASNWVKDPYTGKPSWRIVKNPYNFMLEMEYWSETHE